MADKNPTAEAQSLADLQKSIATMQGQLNQLSRENDALKKQVQKSAAPAKAPELPKLPVNNAFEVSGETYEFLAPAFLHEGKQVTAVDALADEAILASLVAKQSGVIREKH